MYFFLGLTPAQKILSQNPSIVLPRGLDLENLIVKNKNSSLKTAIDLSNIIISIGNLSTDNKWFEIQCDLIESFAYLDWSSDPTAISSLLCDFWSSKLVSQDLKKGTKYSVFNTIMVFLENKNVLDIINNYPIVAFGLLSKLLLDADFSTSFSELQNENYFLSAMKVSSILINSLSRANPGNSEPNYPEMLLASVFDGYNYIDLQNIEPISKYLSNLKPNAKLMVLEMIKSAHLNFFQLSLDSVLQWMLLRNTCFSIIPDDDSTLAIKIEIFELSVSYSNENICSYKTNSLTLSMFLESTIIPDFIIYSQNSSNFLQQMLSENHLELSSVANEILSKKYLKLPSLCPRNKNPFLTQDFHPSAISFNTKSIRSYGNQNYTLLFFKYLTLQLKSNDIPHILTNEASPILTESELIDCLSMFSYRFIEENPVGTSKIYQKLHKISAVASEIILSDSTEAESQNLSELTCKIFQSSRNDIILSQSEFFGLISTLLVLLIKNKDSLRLFTITSFIKCLNKNHSWDNYLREYYLDVAEAYYLIGEFDSSYLSLTEYMDHLANIASIQRKNKKNNLKIVESLDKVTLLYCSILSISMRSGSYLQKFNTNYLDFYLYLESLMSNLAHIILEYPEISDSFMQLRLFYSKFIEFSMIESVSFDSKMFSIPTEIKNQKFIHLLSIELKRLESEKVLFNCSFMLNEPNSTPIEILESDLLESMKRMSSFDSHESFNSSCQELLSLSFNIPLESTSQISICDLLTNPKSSEILVSDYFYSRYSNILPSNNSLIFENITDLNFCGTRIDLFNTNINEYSNLLSMQNSSQQNVSNPKFPSCKNRSIDYLTKIIAKKNLTCFDTVYNISQNLFYECADINESNSRILGILPEKFHKLVDLFEFDYILNNAQHFGVQDKERSPLNIIQQNSFYSILCEHEITSKNDSDFRSTSQSNNICSFPSVDEILMDAFSSLPPSFNDSIKSKAKFSYISYQYIAERLSKGQLLGLMISLVSESRSYEIERVIPTRMFSIVTSSDFELHNNLDHWINWLYPMIYHLSSGLASESYNIQNNCCLLLSHLIDAGKIDSILNFVLSKRSKNPCFSLKDNGSTNFSAAKKSSAFVNFLVDKMRSINGEMVCATESFILESQNLTKLINDEFVELFIKIKSDLAIYFDFQFEKNRIKEILNPLINKISQPKLSSTYEISFVSKFKPLIKDLVSFSETNISKFSSFELFWNSKNSFASLLYSILNFSNTSSTKGYVSMSSVNSRLNSICTVPIPILLKPLSTTKNSISESSNIAYIKSISNSFKLLQQTKTRPKLINMTIDINNESQYVSFILKGGEDLNSDLRIMQIWQTINETISDLKLVTYGVIPTGYNGGYIQVVNNLYSLFSIYKKHFKSHEFKKMVSAELGDLSNPLKLFELAKKSSRGDKIKTYIKLSELVPDNLVYRFLMENSTSSYSFILNNQNFCRSLAGISISGYLVGLGDRHLDNIMLNVKTGQLANIDLNMNFDRGLLLKNAETVPFRMTRCLQYFVGNPNFKSNFNSIRGGNVYLNSCSKMLLSCKRIKEQLTDVAMKSFEFDPAAEWIRLSNKNFNFDFTADKNQNLQDVPVQASNESEITDISIFDYQIQSQQSAQLFSQEISASEISISAPLNYNIASENSEDSFKVENLRIESELQTLKVYTLFKNELQAIECTTIEMTGIPDFTKSSFIPSVKSSIFRHSFIDHDSQNGVSSYINVKPELPIHSNSDYQYSENSSSAEKVSVIDAFKNSSLEDIAEPLLLSSRLIAVYARRKLIAKLNARVTLNSNEFFSESNQLITKKSDYDIGRIFNDKCEYLSNTEKHSLLLWQAASCTNNLINMYEGWGFWF
ncbi:Serine/threonine-protein kinase smg-1 [Smittium culicis]|uniref:Serine/threonine-protein kinase smg-1 n=1 Tax=Smittium culicis TaxID=133412 RepID=A0A1R1YD35_9FUNG|nr:Serine/threonine-protein kinase smg-1 [Smittium culicis]